MSTKLVCDFCDEAISGDIKITSTENDGTKLDFCSSTCFIDYAKGGRI
ncbi:hypothetical protein ACFFGR_09380 [Arthrobacter liuii]|uniref:TRASH domain-containing protein n=1 Tax=Arthrobacter liuii TaxID=1476996 RepID=A0ABQ2AQB9_9MICC|nr:hypothetical protein [Arthrobacter liuii]GGH93871.1 hypothetical protein GCM10007170_15750 [Arthrobacter liuii]